MSKLKVRVISALSAVFVLFLVYYFFLVDGLFFVSALVFAIGSTEFKKMALTTQNKQLRRCFDFFVILSLVVLATKTRWPSLLTHFESLHLLTLIIIFYTLLILWLSRNKISSDELYPFILRSILGFLYCALFPSYIFKILLLPKGDFLIFSFLCIVFAGDTFAYFGGKRWGKNKLMPLLSPNKTIEGSIAGTLAALFLGLLTLQNHWSHFSILGLVFGILLVSFVAQTGDLFESLIKRSSNVKDSGQILPGHGGVLDRLDGVYFSAPVFYLIIQLISGK